MSESLHEILDRVIAKEATTEELIAAIKSGADVNEKKDYYTPLQRVVGKKMGSELVQALIDAGADVNAYATKDDLTDEDREGIEEGDYEEYEVYNGAEYAALFEASATNQLDIMKMLIDAGADVNLICGNGDYDTYPALTRAQTKEAIELLILNGAKVNMVYGDGEGTCTVLGDKVENSNISPECVLTLLRAGAASVAQTPYSELIDYYLQKHSEADEKTLAQIRTLWERNNEEREDELDREFALNRKRIAAADDSEEDDDDDDDWDYDDDSDEETEDEDDSDEENEDEDEENDEDEEDESQSLHDLIEGAFFGVDEDDLEAAIAAGADVNATDAEGKTPLHCVADSPCSSGSCVHVLIKAGADVNAKDRDGNTPLIYAIGDVVCSYLGEIEVIKALLESGADVHAKGKYGTALDVVKRIMQAKPDKTTEAEEIIALLRQYGAK